MGSLRVVQEEWKLIRGDLRGINGHGDVRELLSEILLDLGSPGLERASALARFDHYPRVVHHRLLDGSR